MLSLAWRDLRGSGRHLWVFWACLVLGVTLVSASGGVFRQVSDGLLADTRALFGGDLEVRDRAPLAPGILAWMEERGEVSLLVELRTMLMTGDGRPLLVELQSVDDRYPLYGEVELAPAMRLDEAVAERDGRWGLAFDPVLGERLGIAVGDRVRIGALELELRARIERQPDRSLSADWRGPPVIIAAEALEATGLVRPGSRLSYEYRVKTGADAERWQVDLAAAFPGTDFEVRTFAHRRGHIARVIDQVGSGLLLVGFSALFIGGLGVFNSVQAYLQSKLATIATLRALGLREARLAALYLAQVLLLAGSASLAGVLAGGALAAAAAGVIAEELPLAPALADLAGPLAIAWLFGVLTAVTFALPALGRALSVSPAALFRGIDGAATRTPARWWHATGALAAATCMMVLVALPQPAFGLGFVAVMLALLVLLEGLVRLLRHGAHRLADHPLLGTRFALRLALANLYRPGAPVRAMLLSLGSALTVLVASAVVVATLVRTIDDTVPKQAPALVFYDVSTAQIDEFREIVGGAKSLARLDVAPLVLGRLTAVDGEAMRASADARRVTESRDEHKMSYRRGNFDHLELKRGAWWPEDYRGPPLVAMEDWEADQAGLEVGDRLRFEISGDAIEATLVAIYGQRRFQSRFWLEAVFTDGVLDPFITRYVGAAYLDDTEAAGVQARLAAAMPNVVTVLTARILAEARGLLGRASAGLAVVAGVSLLASLLVLVSVIATSRARQVYESSVLHTLGARIALVRRGLALEYALVAVLTSAFAIVLGSALAIALLEYRVRLATEGEWMVGAAVAALVAAASLGLGARHTLAQLKLSPAMLLRAGG